MVMVETISAVLLGAGALLGLIGGIGLLRFPDFYTRLHAASITDTLCAALLLSGLAVQFGATLASAKLGLIFAFLLFTSPTAAHALGKSALRSGLMPWGVDSADLARVLGEPLSGGAAPQAPGASPAAASGDDPEPDRVASP